MKKLSKTQLKERDKLTTDINEAHCDLEAAINAYNTAIGEAKSKVEEALTAYNEKITAAREFCEQIVSDMESYEGDRSEKWADSDAGSAFADWKSEWENVQLDDVELEFPDEMEIPENVQETIDMLPEEASS